MGLFDFFKRNKQEDKEEPVQVYAPVAGESIDLETVNDPVFSTNMMGKGIAVEPSTGSVVSPIEGEVVSVFPTNHAVGLKTPSGLELLIHIGIDTVALDGQGFEGLVTEGQEVQVGTPLVNVDWDELKAEGYDPTVMLVVTNTQEEQEFEPSYGQVQVGDQILVVRP